MTAILTVALLAAIAAGLTLAAFLYSELRDTRREREIAHRDLGIARHQRDTAEHAYWDLYRQAWTVPAPADTQPVNWLADEPYGPEQDTDPLTAPTIAVDDLEHTGPIGRTLGRIPAMPAEAADALQFMAESR